MEKVSIFFDTNVLEAKHSSSRHFLSDIKANNDFYNTHKFVNDNELDISLCIPEIVFLELQKHLTNAFSSECQSFETVIRIYKKGFGDLLDISHEFKKTKDVYLDFFMEIWESFQTKFELQVIEYPKQKEAICNIVSNAINTIKPFSMSRTVEKGSTKDYSDAGFKDAMIALTIINYQISTGDICLFLTSDKDFDGVFNDCGNKIKVFNKYEDLKVMLTTHFGLTDIEIIRERINKDKYIQEKIISETGNVFDESVTNFAVTDIKEDKDNEYIATIMSVINETIYHIVCKYEAASNDIIDITYNTQND